MFRRKKTGAVLCASCGKLVGVGDKECYNCGRKNPGMFGFAPFLRELGMGFGFTDIVIWGCSALYLVTLLVDTAGIRSAGFDVLCPSMHSLFRFGASGAFPVFGVGRWWTVLSAGWLHGGLLHIVLNMMWVRQLAPATGELYGVPRMAIIYSISSVCGFALSSLAGAFGPALPLMHGAQFTIGASAPVFGLLGALAYYGRRSGSSHIRGQAMYYAVVMFIFGLVMQGIDNFAHLGGFAGGYFAAKVLDPFKPEKVAHTIAALALTAATALSVLASLLHGKLF
jgi:rhomboid protease GluP